MAKLAIVYTPTRAPRGKVVHAASLIEAMRTACGARMSGWVASTQALSCRNCKHALHKELRIRRGDE